MPAGTSIWPFEAGRYERNRRQVAAHADYLRARADQADACVALIKKRRELLLEIASLQDLPEEIAHRRELGRLNRLNELRLIQLQHELAQTDARIAVAGAQLRLVQLLPVPVPVVPPAPAPPAPPPPPAGLTPADVRKVLQAMPEIRPEAIETLVLMLSGVLAEKNP